MPHFFVKHPIVKLVKGFFGGSCPVIVRPTANDGVEFPQDFLRLPSSYRFPFLLHLLTVLLASFFARFGQQLPPRFRLGDPAQLHFQTSLTKPPRQLTHI